MALWGKAGSANNAPKFVAEATSGVQPTCNVAYANTTVGAFTPSAAIGVFEVSAAEAVAYGKGASPGWVKKKFGTGPVATVALGAGSLPGGTGYGNTNLVRVSGGTTNAAASIVTHANGTINTLTLTTAGAGFINTASATVAVTNATGGATAGSGANVVITLGGRAGRVDLETLVAFAGDPSSNGSII